MTLFSAIYCSILISGLLLLGQLYFSATRMAPQLCFIWVLYCFFSFLSLFFLYNPYTAKYFFLTCFTFGGFFPLCFGLDAIALSLLVLTTFMFSICFLMNTDVAVGERVQRFFFLNFILLLLILITLFSVLDFFSFYLLFELSLVPLFLIVGAGSSSFNRAKAAYLLFLYPFFLSLLMLFVFFYLFSYCGNLSFFLLLGDFYLDDQDQYFLWIIVFCAFAAKIPMVPFHIWLPEAHVEAPTSGSIVLAAIILKLGGFGFYRYLVPLFPTASLYFRPLGITLALISAFYAGITALRQIDMKRIIAYSSIVHMNIGVSGFFTLSPLGGQAFLFLMLGHGLISGALFFLVGCLYTRYHTRLFSYFSGLTLRMPLFASFFFFFTLANTAFPLTWNFVGEVGVLFTLAQTSYVGLFMLGMALFCTTCYSFWLYSKMCFGTLRLTNTMDSYDLNRFEVMILMWLVSFTLIGGLFPSLIFRFFFFF